MKGSPYKVLGIVIKPGLLEEDPDFFCTFLRWEGWKGHHLYFTEDVAQKIKNIPGSEKVKISFLPFNELYCQVDLLISLGGDGTLIHTCRHIGRRSPPILGVNLGHLGFIAEFTREEIWNHLTECLRGSYPVVVAHLFTVKVIHNGMTKWQESFVNDAVVAKNNISRIFTLQLETEQGEHIYDLAGDGIIVSSPLGSTAYSLAAGGPICHPSVKAMILSPICPHGLTHRPMVIPDQNHLKIKLKNADENVVLTLDGQSSIDISKNDEIIIYKEKDKLIHLIKNPEKSYYQTLETKFFHGKREGR